MHGPRVPQSVALRALVEKERDEYAERLARGKGTWPGPDYVRDETWAGWLAVHGALDSILHEAARAARATATPSPKASPESTED